MSEPSVLTLPFAARTGARVLMVISVSQPDHQTRAAIEDGRQPRRDFDELQRVLGADILYLGSEPTASVAKLAIRVLGTRIGRRVALAHTVFARRYDYDVIYTDTDSVGLPLAMLLKLSRTSPQRVRHATLAHNLSSMRNPLAARYKRLLMRCRIDTHISTMIVHSSAQQELATERFGVAGSRVVRLPYQVDTHFWHPIDATAAGDGPTAMPIVSIPGHECRDYPTMLRAVAGLEIDARISTRAVTAEQAAMTERSDWPPNLSFNEYSYETLRQLYADARFVVVPLLDVDFQAGITVVLEAMAMGKAVILSGIRGQTDVVRDSRDGARGLLVRDWWPGFGEAAEITEGLQSLPTGLYVTPGDPDELRATIQQLLDDPDQAEELGRNGRAVAEAFFRVESFADRFGAAIIGRIDRTGPGQRAAATAEHAA